MSFLALSDVIEPTSPFAAALFAFHCSTRSSRFAEVSPSVRWRPSDSQRCSEASSATISMQAHGLIVEIFGFRWLGLAPEVPNVRHIRDALLLDAASDVLCWLEARLRIELIPSDIALSWESGETQPALHSILMDVASSYGNGRVRISTARLDVLVPILEAFPAELGMSLPVSHPSLQERFSLLHVDAAASIRREALDALKPGDGIVLDAVAPPNQSLLGVIQGQRLIALGAADCGQSEPYRRVSTFKAPVEFRDQVRAPIVASGHEAIVLVASGESRIGYRDALDLGPGEYLPVSGSPAAIAQLHVAGKPVGSARLFHHGAHLIARVLELHR